MTFLDFYRQTTAEVALEVEKRFLKLEFKDILRKEIYSEDNVFEILEILVHI